MAGLATLFGGGSSPKVQTVPVPARSDAAIQKAAADERNRQRSGSLTNDWLTGGFGVPRSDQTFAATRLLGGTQ